MAARERAGIGNQGRPIGRPCRSHAPGAGPFGATQFTVTDKSSTAWSSSRLPTPPWRQNPGGIGRPRAGPGHRPACPEARPWKSGSALWRQEPACRNTIRWLPRDRARRARLLHGHRPEEGAALGRAASAAADAAPNPQRFRPRLVRPRQSPNLSSSPPPRPPCKQCGTWSRPRSRPAKRKPPAPAAKSTPQRVRIERRAC